MSLRHMAEYRDPELSRPLIEQIRAKSRRPVRLMEVCGTHTMSIFRSGLRGVLPETISLLSGPGCPVCVTAQGEIDAFVDLARREGVTVATFGDLLRVPGAHSTLEKERAAGRDVRIVYSATDAVELARKRPERTVVFLGIGFETTAPTVAAAILAARQAGLENFRVFSAHKRVLPALFALTADPELAIDGFLLPGHVSIVLGLDGYRPLFERHPLPCVVAGFEPTDILRAVLRLVEQVEADAPALENAYGRAVTENGNAKARQIMDTVFEPGDAVWRGMGNIPDGGLFIREAFAPFDARRAFDVSVEDVPEPPGCACGEVITARRTPPECPLFRKRCTPMRPVGPCMVSSEGACAAWYRFHSEE
ncbi:MAG: hydrogenase formation protein HypD [Desulfococcaceae bacterium]